MTYSRKDLKQLQKKLIKYSKLELTRKSIWKKIKGKLRRWKMRGRKKFIK